MRFAANQRRDAGFTLIETMLVVVIMGVGLAIAVPKLRDNWDARQAAAAADVFVRDHELARVTAVRFGRDAMLHIDSANVTFWVDVDTNGSGVRAIIGDKHSYKNNSLTLGTTDTLLCFDMRGLRSGRNGCQTGAATIAFAGLLHVDTLQITALGKVLR